MAVSKTKAGAKTGSKGKGKGKAKSPIIISPAAVAAYAWLAKPDTKFDDEGKYKVTLLLPKKDKAAKPFIDQLLGMSKKLVKDGDKMDKDEFKGMALVQFKSAYKPDMRDSKKNELPEKIRIMSGDVIRVAFKASEYDPGKYTLYLQAVQLIEKRTASGAGGDAFDEVDDGYVAETGPKKGADEEEGDEDVDF